MENLKNPIELTPESWDEARQLASAVGVVPSSFTSTVRGLMADQEKGQLSSSTRFLITRLLKGDSIRSPLYFASTIFLPEKLEERGAVNTKAFLGLYSPADLAALLSLMYLYRRLKRMCDQKEWEFLSLRMHYFMELGGYIGSSMPALSIGNGLLIGGLRDLGLGLLLTADKKTFIDYRRSLKETKSYFDYSKEMELFGCTSVQLGSVLVLTAGLGKAISEGFANALLYNEDGMQGRGQGAERTFRRAEQWLMILLATGKVPSDFHDGKFYPNPEYKDRLSAHVGRIFSKEPEILWLEKGKEDISPETTPALFADAPAAPEPAPTPENAADQDLENTAEELEEMLK